MKRNAITYTAILLVTLLAFGLRMHAARTLDIAPDEPVYLNAALDYANFMRAGEWSRLAWHEENFEHPPFFKYLYAGVMLTQDPLEEMWEKDFKRLAPIDTAPGKPWAMAGRYTSVAIATLANLVLAILNPVAGLFMAVHTTAINYTSTYYLEALPLLTSLLSALFYLRWFGKVNRGGPVRASDHLGLGLSALALGISAASKYVYCVVGLAIGAHFLLAALQNRSLWRQVGYVAACGALAVGFFFVFDPYLWLDPYGRLMRSIFHHVHYHELQFVQDYNYPFWQPFVWLSGSIPAHFPELKESFLIALDPVISLLALAGLPRLWNRNRFFFLWLVIGVIILLAWPTKWTQYIMIIVVPLGLAADAGIRSILALLNRGRLKFASGQDKANI